MSETMLSPNDILYEVQEAFSWSMEFFSLDDIIDNTDRLTDEERTWAKEHLACGVFIEEQK